MSSRVLIVEDSRAILSYQKSRIEESLHFDVDTAMSLAQTTELVEKNPQKYFIALLDLNLPDAQEGEVVDYIISKNIPVVVFTGTYNDDIRDTLLSKHIVDYVIKDNPHNFDYVIRLVKFIHQNKNTEILIVDDSSLSRLEIKNLLLRFPVIVHEAKNGVEALVQLKRHPHIKMVVIDKNMPEMDGIELTRRIRKEASQDDLAIIGISSYGNSLTNVAFIKSGANDFINKPFSDEVFTARFVSNMLMIDYIKEAREFANKDYLTGLYNRKYLHEAGSKLYEIVKKKEEPMAVCMIDIDHFKSINDSYGHAAGDRVIQTLAGALEETFKHSDIIARYGGEEFCLLMPGTTVREAYETIDALREKLGEMEMFSENERFYITFSAGINGDFTHSLEKMIDEADKRLYAAKESGRNRVVC